MTLRNSKAGQSRQSQASTSTKMIKFRSRATDQILAQSQIPSYSILNNGKIYDIQQLSHHLQILYLDVINRGHYPLKSKQTKAKDIFGLQQAARRNKEAKLSRNQFVSVNYLSSNQAVSTIWRCIGRQIGRPIKNYNFSQVRKQLQIQLQKLRPKKLRKDINKDIQKYTKIQQQIQEIQKLINIQMQQILKKSEEAKLTKPQQKKIWNALQQQILDLQQKVFLTSIIGIRQCKQNSEMVQLIFEQSYPTIKISRKKAIQILGEVVFTHRWDMYHKYIGQQAQQNQIMLAVCHKCLCYLNNSRYVWQCSDKCATSSVTHSLLSDPYIYNSVILNQLNSQEKKGQKYMHSYLSYYSLCNSEKNFVCNRYICQQCVQDDPNILNSENCGYCEGNCQCSRCQSLDMLTKIMAVYIEQEGDLHQLTSKFKMKFDSKTLNISSKKNIKIKSQSIVNFQRCLSSCLYSNIFINQEDMKKYRKVFYYSNQISKQVELELKMHKIKKQKLNKQSQQLQISNENSKNKKKHKSKNTNNRIVQKQKQQSKNESNLNAQKQKGEADYQEIDCYYQDSSS